MSNLRVVYDNAADRATLSSSATAGSLGYSNLTSDIKSKVCRSTTTTLMLTATWGAPETINVAALAFTNLSNAATMRVQGYTNAGDSTPAYDSTVSCSQGSASYGNGVNSFAYGSGVYACSWLTSTITVAKLVITITDPTNTNGYVEAGRLIIGNAWTPIVGVDQQGTSMTVVDQSQQYRTDAGDQWVTVKAKYRKQTLSLPSLNSVDRKQMWNILWSNGMTKPLFMSLYPNNADTSLEQVHMIYGRLSVNPVMQTPYFQYHSATVEIEEV